MLPSSSSTMMYPSLELFAVVIYTFLISPCWGAVSQPVWDAEKNQQAVDVEFYNTGQATWVDKKYEAHFSSIISTLATSYCNSNPGSCYMVKPNTSSTVTTFSDSHVYYTTGYPVEERSYLRLRYYLAIPPGTLRVSNPPTQYILVASATKRITIDAMPRIQKEMSVSVTKVGDEEYDPPPPMLINIIMIAIGVVLLLCLLIFCVACSCYTRKEEKKRRKDNSDTVILTKVNSAKKSGNTSRVGHLDDNGYKNGHVDVYQNPNNDSTLKDNGGGNGGALPPMASHHDYESALREREGMGADIDASRRQNALPPLAPGTGSPDERRRQRKKKDRKNRERKPESAGGFQNATYSSDQEQLLKQNARAGYDSSNGTPVHNSPIHHPNPAYNISPEDNYNQSDSPQKDGNADNDNKDSVISDSEGPHEERLNSSAKVTPLYQS